MCAEALGISRKNLYRPLKQPAKDQTLKEQTEAVHRQHPAYGHRRVALHLGINYKCAQRVMAQFNLRPQTAHPALQRRFDLPSHLSQSAQGHEGHSASSGLVQ